MDKMYEVPIRCVCRLAKLICALQSPKANAADLASVWSYLDALRDLGFIDHDQKTLLLRLVDLARSNIQVKGKPYAKYRIDFVRREINTILDSLAPYSNPRYNDQPD